MARLKSTICWTLIFILRMRFPLGTSIDAELPSLLNRHLAQEGFFCPHLLSSFYLRTLPLYTIHQALHR